MTEARQRNKLTFGKVLWDSIRGGRTINVYNSTYEDSDMKNKSRIRTIGKLQKEWGASTWDSDPNLCNYLQCGLIKGYRLAAIKKLVGKLFKALNEGVIR